MRSRASLALAAVLLLTVPALGVAFADGGGPSRPELHFDVLDEGPEAVEPAPEPEPVVPEEPAASAEARRLAVVLVALDGRRPWARETVARVVFGRTGSVSAYYREVSHGSLALEGDVLGWYPIPFDGSTCAPWEWADAADAVAADAGVDLSGYAHVVYAFAQVPSCRFAGAAVVDGTRSWINGSLGVRTIAHELGHNLGADHASALACTNGQRRVALSQRCTVSEYGDPFSVMGGSAAARHHTNWHRARLGWLQEVVTVESAGTYGIVPAHWAAAPLVRVPRGDGTFFYLELRRPSGAYDGFAASDPVVHGVSIRLAPDVGEAGRSLLVDTTSRTRTFADAALRTGRTFADPVSGVSITTLAVSARGARVRVAFGGSVP